MNKNIKLYEDFHEVTSSQEKIIVDDNFTYRIILDVINKHLLKGYTLDIGCGAGTIDFYLADKGFNIMGIDISQKAISSATQTVKKMNLKDIVFKKVDFPKNLPEKTFDNILCFEVIEHLKDDKLALRKIYNLLKKNGTAIISTPSQNAPVYRLGLANKFDKRVGHLRRYKLDELISMTEELGFHVVTTYKSEGLIRNFLFVNPVAGKFIRFIKGPLVNIVSKIDAISLSKFGESDLFIVLKKP